MELFKDLGLPGWLGVVVAVVFIGWFRSQATREIQTAQPVGKRKFSLFEKVVLGLLVGGVLSLIVLPFFWI